MSEIVTPQELVARTLGLLSRAAIQGVCQRRMKELIQHLEFVSNDQTLDISIRDTTAKLVAEWKQIQTKEFGTQETTAYH